MMEELRNETRDEELAQSFVKAGSSGCLWDEGRWVVQRNPELCEDFLLGDGAAEEKQLLLGPSLGRRGGEAPDRPFILPSKLQHISPMAKPS